MTARLFRSLFLKPNRLSIFKPFSSGGRRPRNNRTMATETKQDVPVAATPAPTAAAVPVAPTANGGAEPKLRNIEIKARVGSDKEFQRRLEIAKKLSENNGEIIAQHDVFFNSTNGRLKLRYLKNRLSQLIYYSRPNVEGPKLSEYHVIETDNPKLMEQILGDSIGIKGIVRKTRHLYMYKQTRIHLDQVEQLGNFMEFEVCLQPNETIEFGTKIANYLMKEFGIKDEDLMTGAYMDELMKK